MIGLAFGLPGVGKTQALLDYVGALARQNRFFVVDRAGDWVPDSHRWRGVKWKRWSKEVALLGGEGPFFVTAPAPEESASWLRNLPPHGVVRFGWPWEGLDVARLVREVGNSTYVDDELDFVATTSGWSTNPLRDFCHRGRHLPNAQGEVGEVHILGAARRAQSLHIDVTSLCDFAWVFRIAGHRTLERLVEDRILEDDGEAERARTQELYAYKLWRSNGESTWGQLATLKEPAFEE